MRPKFKAKIEGQCPTALSLLGYWLQFKKLQSFTLAAARVFLNHVRIVLVVLTLVTASQGAIAYDSSVTVTGHEVPKELQNAGIKERLGMTVWKDALVTDDSGQTKSFGSVLSGKRPTLFSIVYYSCPSLCNLHLNGVLATLKELDLKPGRDFDVVALSMDHRESFELASEKKASYLEAYGDKSTQEGWHFLVAAEPEIKAIASSVGFSFEWNEATQQFAHASAAIILSPSGVISRYLHGIEFDKVTLRMALIEAGQGLIGSVVDKLLLFCFQYNPVKSKYTLYAFNLMRIGAVLIVLLLGLLLVPTWLREKWKSPRPT